MFDIFYKLFSHRHFWRDLSFSELSDLYVSYMLRTMAISVIGIFIPVYLYELGFSIVQIAIFYVSVYGIRMLVDPFIGIAILKYGAKFILKISYPLTVINLGLLIALQTYDIHLFWVALVEAIAIGTFFLPFNLEYSYLKHNSREGAELGLLEILKKVAGALGPLVGGLIATWFGISVTLYMAMILTLLAALPLFINPDGADLNHQKKPGLQYYAENMKHLVPLTGYGFALAGATLIWPLFLSVFVLLENVYASLGLLVSASFLISIFSTHFFGKIIDNNKSRELLNYTAITNGFLFMIRPFVNTFSSALALNFAADPIGNALGMVYHKAFYDTAESEQGNRLNSIIVLSAFVHLARFLIFGLIALAAFVISAELALKLSFLLSGLGSIILVRQKFEVLKK